MKNFIVAGDATQKRRARETDDLTLFPFGSAMTPAHVMSYRVPPSRWNQVSLLRPLGQRKPFEITFGSATTE